jgi:ribosomal subunit interface protein
MGAAVHVIGSDVPPCPVVCALQRILKKEANVQLPLQITYRDMDPTPGMDAAIRDKVDHLQRYHPRIVRCHVVVDAPHASQHHPHHFRVMFNLTIPGKEIVAAKENHDKPEQRDFYIALRDSYEAARRQLESEREKAQGHTKVHEVPPHGRVSKLFPGQDYGFVFMPDGNEVYFHRNAVVEGSWEDIEIGDEVRVVVQEGNEGLQASTVKPIGKHHLPPVEAI